MLPILQEAVFPKLTALISNETIISVFVSFKKKSDLANEKTLFKDDPTIHKLLL